MACDHALPGAEWHRTLAAERAAYAVLMATDEAEDAGAYDRAGSAWSAIDTTLMEMPAPDRDALREKLARLFPPGGDGRSLASWSWDYAGQTIRDLRRLLRETARG